MSSYAEVVALVEGPTERNFIKQVLAPYMGTKGIFLRPAVLEKPGQKGGDVKFARAKNDILKHMKQRSDTWVTLMVDYYGIDSDWPGYKDSKGDDSHIRKAELMNAAMDEAISEILKAEGLQSRFISYVSMHEIEALFFSEPETLARELGVNERRINQVLDECGEPEKINDNPKTAPSKRLKSISSRFKKNTTGIAIARKIGIERMREVCPIFDGWLKQLEDLAK